MDPAKKRKNWIFNDERFIARRLKDEYIVMNLYSGHYYTLESTGALIFGLVLDDHPAGEIERELLRRYPSAPPARVRRDLEHLLKDLCSKEIVRSAAA